MSDHGYGLNSPEPPIGRCDGFGSAGVPPAPRSSWTFNTAGASFVRTSKMPALPQHAGAPVQHNSQHVRRRLETVCSSELLYYLIAHLLAGALCFSRLPGQIKISNFIIRR